VRLPDGSHASRRFARADAFCRVHDWCVCAVLGEGHCSRSWPSVLL
jgi:hypothetical protein